MSESDQQRRDTRAVPAAAGATGHPEVDEVVASLDGLDDVPVSEHPAVFERAQARLRAVLDDTVDGPAAAEPASGGV